MNKRNFDYAIALIEYLKKQNGEFIGIHIAAEELKLPRAYLEKVAQGLKRGGILEGRRGIGGGYCLSAESANISIDSLINFYSMYYFCPLLRKIKFMEVQPR